LQIQHNEVKHALRIAYQILVENPERRDHLEDLGISGRMILKCKLKDIGYKGMYWS
jgi:hypothetical protein